VSWMSAWWSQVSETTTQGLEITVVGMLLVFFTLGLIILSLVLLTRLPGLKAKERAGESTEMPEQTVAQAVAPEPEDTDAELARVAVIAVAILRSRQRTARPRAQGPRNAWRNYGRAHQLGL
jgi:sodium pump decarboxylase gamma subunit